MPGRCCVPSLQSRAARTSPDSMMYISDPISPSIMMQSPSRRRGCHFDGTPLFIPVETPDKGRGGCSRVTEPSPTARVALQRDRVLQLEADLAQDLLAVLALLHWAAIRGDSGHHDGGQCPCCCMDYDGKACGVLRSCSALGRNPR